MHFNDNQLFSWRSRMLCAAMLVYFLATTGNADAVSEAAPASVPTAGQAQFDEAMRALRAGEMDQASLTFQELALRYPTLVSPLINLGLMEQKQNRHESAVSYFVRALERAPDSPVVYTNLGVSYRNLGKLKDAETVYLAAIAADSNYPQAHFNLAILQDVYLQNPEKAIHEYETYQSLLTVPDTKVTAWIKDIKGRIGELNGKAASTGAQP